MFKRRKVVVDCVICQDSVDECTAVLCDGSEPHAMCRGCFSMYVSSESTKEVRILCATGGKIQCPLVVTKHCDAKEFDTKAIASTVSSEAFDHFMASHKDMVEQQVILKMESDNRRKLDTEVDRILQMDEDSRRVHVARTHVVDNILSLSCPRCRQVFMDFSGCFSLKCSRCGCGFCAWCLKDCGRDAHDHLIDKLCLGPGKDAIDKMNNTKLQVSNRMYGNVAQYKQQHLNRRAALLRTYMDILDADLQVKVVEACKNDLADIGLLEMFMDRAEAKRIVADRKVVEPSMEGVGQPHVDDVDLVDDDSEAGEEEWRMQAEFDWNNLQRAMQVSLVDIDTEEQALERALRSVAAMEANPIGVACNKCSFINTTDQDSCLLCDTTL